MRLFAVLLILAGAGWGQDNGRYIDSIEQALKQGMVTMLHGRISVQVISSDPEWAKREGIRGLGGQPLIYRGEVIGVLAIFTRVPLVRRSLIWLRMIADHAAISIANARAFEQIQQLRTQLECENEYLREEVQEVSAFGDIVGQSPALRNILEQIELVAATDAAVLITGESGTGKELVARAVHANSARRDGPFVPVNCATVPQNLAESLVFGHTKGAFIQRALDQTEGNVSAAARLLGIDRYKIYRKMKGGAGKTSSD